jgi:hypothetical protein
MSVRVWHILIPWLSWSNKRSLTPHPVIFRVLNFVYLVSSTKRSPFLLENWTLLSIRFLIYLCWMIAWRMVSIWVVLSFTLFKTKVCNDVDCEITSAIMLSFFSEIVRSLILIFDTVEFS